MIILNWYSRSMTAGGWSWVICTETTTSSRWKVFEGKKFCWKNFWWNRMDDTVDGWNPANQLRLVAYPIIYRVLYIPGGCLGFLNHQPITHFLGSSFINSSLYVTFTRMKKVSIKCSYCWLFRNPANQLRLVLYLIIFKVWYIQNGAWGWDFWMMVQPYLLRFFFVKSLLLYFQCLGFRHSSQDLLLLSTVWAVLIR